MLLILIAESKLMWVMNKQMEFSYGTKKWRSTGVYVAPSKEAVEPTIMEFALGLHAPGRFDKILPVHKCLLQHDVANQVTPCTHLGDI